MDSLITKAVPYQLSYGGVSDCDGGFISGGGAKRQGKLAAIAAAACHEAVISGIIKRMIA